MPVYTTAIRCFEEVARRGSIRRSAEYLHLTPSAVNRQILSLEAEFATALFERLPRGMRLTAAGETLLASVHRQEQDLQTALSQIEALKGLNRGHVVMASLSHFAPLYLTAFLARFRARHRGITFTVLTGTSEEVTQLVADGNADIGVCFRPGRGIPVKVIKSVPARFGAAMSVRHPLAERSRVRVQECVRYPLVLPCEGMESRTLAEQLGLKRWPDRLVVVETSSFTLLVEMIKADIGLSFLSDFDVADQAARETITFVPLAEVSAPTPQVCAIVRADRTLPFAIAIVLERLGEHLDQIAGDAAAFSGGKSPG
jgi:DNA-binding transcriptional LysR family regulator